jgi:peptide deformylase
MELPEIKKYPDRILRQKTRRVREITSEEISLFDVMLSTMRRFEGIGLAAPQIGINKSLIVVDIGEGPIKIANPVIVDGKGNGILKEGCLSFPGLEVFVQRAERVVVEGVNARGKGTKIKASGLLARVLQHEIDHLCGFLIIDYASFWERLKYRSKLTINKRLKNINTLSALSR